ncbi:hypothetical protein [Spirulina sp. 06S082]|uniref:hypothetical protein n=1 Tax=Spirulina sp. 06S082 TaxID=3110248 RepID=UPI002B21CDBC|nr:hypothetical protein [Spirulina sp. 06S082]MEA5468960.1 hypothetical protein [Spirulina sp. 06S082]
MAKNLVNLTLLFVKEDINQILTEQPDHIQKDFMKRDLFPDLIAYVLSRIPNNYNVFEEERMPPIHSYLLSESAERQLAREQMIRRGIYVVLEKSFHKTISTAHLKKEKEPLSV